MKRKLNLFLPIFPNSLLNRNCSFISYFKRSQIVQKFIIISFAMLLYIEKFCFMCLTVFFFSLFLFLTIRRNRESVIVIKLLLVKAGLDSLLQQKQVGVITFWFDWPAKPHSHLQTF